MPSIYRDSQRHGSYIGEVLLEGRKCRVRAGTKKDAAAKLARLIADHARGELPADGNTTVAQAIDEWLTAQPRDRAPRTIENNEWAARVLRAELGSGRLARLTVRDVERALRNIAAGKHAKPSRPGTPTPKPVSRRTLVLMRATMRRVLAFAARRGLVTGTAAMAAEWAELPDAAAQVPRKALTDEQARTLWAALEGELVGPMLRLMLLTGLRSGEAAALCWDAVDLDAQPATKTKRTTSTAPATKTKRTTKTTPTKPATLTVRRGRQMNRNRVVITDQLKTKASARPVGLLPEAVDLLRAQRKTVAAMKLAAGPSWRNELEAAGGLCFPTSTGTAFDPSNVRDELARIAAAAGLPRVTPNELRHTAASLLSDRGVPHAVIADLLGHTTSRMVDTTYRHNLRVVADAAILGDLGNITRQPS